jgi:hypothetical protein
MINARQTVSASALTGATSMTTTTTPIYMTEAELLERFPFIKQSQLRKGRLARDPVDCPPHIRLSPRSIIYREDAVIAWIESKAKHDVGPVRPRQSPCRDGVRRGRPTKAEQMARAAQQQAAE